MDRKSRSLWKLGWFLFALGKVEKSPGTGNAEIQTKKDLQQNLSYFFLFKIISSFLGICTTFLLDCAFASSFVMLAIPRKNKSLPMEFEDQRHWKRFSDSPRQKLQFFWQEPAPGFCRTVHQPRPRVELGTAATVTRGRPWDDHGTTMTTCWRPAPQVLAEMRSVFKQQAELGWICWCNFYPILSTSRVGMYNLHWCHHHLVDCKLISWSGKSSLKTRGSKRMDSGGGSWWTATREARVSVSEPLQV